MSLVPRGTDGEMEAAHRKWLGWTRPRPHPVTPRPGTLPEPSTFPPAVVPLETILESVRPCFCELGPAHGLILPDTQTQTRASLPCLPPLKGCEGGSLVPVHRPLCAPALGSLPSDVTAAQTMPPPTPGLCRASSPQEGGRRPRPEARGVGPPALKPDRAPKGGSPSLDHLCLLC